MKNLIRNNDSNTCKRLTHVFRYIDDITVINGDGILDSVSKHIYSDKLKLVKVNSSPKSADVLDLQIVIQNKVASIRTYDKRRQFSFQAINFPHMNSNVSTRMCYNVFSNQVRRHAFINSDLSDFVHNVQILIDTLIKRGYNEDQLYSKLISTVKPKILTKYQTDLSSLLTMTKD